MIAFKKLKLTLTDLSKIIPKSSSKYYHLLFPLKRYNFYLTHFFMFLRYLKCALKWDILFKCVPLCFVAFNRKHNVCVKIQTFCRFLSF